jgi:hypothetical protein
MTSVGPVYKQQETSSRYCVANDNLCNVRRYCKLLMLQQRAYLGDHAPGNSTSTCIPYGPIFGKQVLPDMLVPAGATLQCEHGLGNA